MKNRPYPVASGWSGKDDSSNRSSVSTLDTVCQLSAQIAHSLARRAEHERSARSAYLASRALTIACDAHALLAEVQDEIADTWEGAAA